MQRNSWTPRILLIVALLAGGLVIGFGALSADEVTPSGGTVPPAPTAVYPAPTQYAPLIFNQPLQPTPPPDVDGGAS